MEAFADYGSDSGDEEGKQENPDFKPAWMIAEEENDDDDDDDDGKKKDNSLEGKSKGLERDKHTNHKHAIDEDSQPQAKKKKLPSALDALKSATPTFLEQSASVDSDEVKDEASRQKDVGIAGTGSNGSKTARNVQSLPETNTSIAEKLAEIQASLEAEKTRDDKKKANWNAKEKRKRDLGQSSRAKNYVEEEKRILRQAGGQ